jgi:membrane-associated phospholipid phosphatase
VKEFIKNNAVIWIPYLVLVTVASYYMYQFEKQAIHIFFNRFVGNATINSFFYYITYLGDGRLAALLLLCIILYNVRTGIYATFSFLSSVIVSNSLKYFFYDDVNRPYFYFQYLDNSYDLNIVEGVDMHIHNSFPSGHATQAFAILMCLAFVLPAKRWKFLIFAIAVITSLSRVYLSQHWLADVTAGSMIGMAASISFYALFIYHDRFQRLNAPLMKLSKKNGTTEQ